MRAFANRWPPLVPGAAVDLDARSRPTGRSPRRRRAARPRSSSTPPTTTGRSPRSASTGARRSSTSGPSAPTALLGRPEIEYVLVFENRGARGRRDDPAPARADLRRSRSSRRCRAREADGRGGARVPAVRRGAATRRRRATRVVHDDGGWVDVRAVRVRVPVRRCSSRRARTSPRPRRPRRRRRATGSPPRSSTSSRRYDRLFDRAVAVPACGSTRACTCTCTSRRRCAAPDVLRYVASGEVGSGDALATRSRPRPRPQPLRDA